MAAAPGGPRGKVWLVGAGPGDPDLMTVKAMRVLAVADVVLFDRLVSPGVLAMANPAAEMLYAGKHEGEQFQVQNWINDQLLTHASRGRIVVRLKSGDPLIFGRGAEEARFLESHGIEVEIVPGLSSALAVPNVAGIPLTFRGLSRGFAVTTGHCQDGRQAEWSRYAQVDTLVILMGVQRRAAIAAELIESGRRPDEPAAFIERGTTESARVVMATLAEVARGEVDVAPPAVFVIGDVVGFAQGCAAAGAAAGKTETAICP